MRKISIMFLLSAGVFFFQYCSSSKKAASAKPETVTYQNHIAPVIQASCAPCHIEGKGKKKPLDNYTAASGSVDEIIERIRKNPGEKGFMPAMHAKLSDSTINLFEQWKKNGLANK
jgi:mono/diheme cytochrome c family protein